ncbi:MAG: hypothetical protein AAFU64_16180 [Bacteroidota bacterium]
MKKKLSYSKIASSLRTGDIILFSCPSTISKVIDTVEDSPYAHVGMVIRLPNHPRPLFWESSHVDVIDDEIKDVGSEGVHLIDLEKLIDLCQSHYKCSYFALRHLYPSLGHKEMAKLEKYMRELDGREFPSIFGMIMHFLEGKLGIKTSERTFFCSELLTATYKELGVIKNDVLVNSLSPANYSAEHENEEVWSGHYDLGPEILFTAG